MDGTAGDGGLVVATAGEAGVWWEGGGGEGGGREERTALCCVEPPPAPPAPPLPAGRASSRGEGSPGVSEWVTLSSSLAVAVESELASFAAGAMPLGAGLKRWDRDMAKERDMPPPPSWEGSLCREGSLLRFCDGHMPVSTPSVW